MNPVPVDELYIVDPSTRNWLVDLGYICNGKRWIYLDNLVRDMQATLGQETTFQIKPASIALYRSWEEKIHEGEVPAQDPEADRNQDDDARNRRGCKVGVHYTHCCAKHGCKYNNPYCPVYIGTINQAYRCEECCEE